MHLSFRDARTFWKETLAVTGGACLAGCAAGLGAVFTETTLGLTLVASAGTASLAGGALGAAAVKSTPSFAWRGVWGTVTAIAAAAAFAVVGGAGAPGPANLVVAGGVGGALLAALLCAAEGSSRRATAVGLGGAAVVGGLGAVGLDRIAAFAVSEGAPTIVTSTTMASLFGLWVVSAAGLRRIERRRDPVVARADALLVCVAEPVHTKLRDGLNTWRDVGDGLERDASMQTDTVDEARRQARLLLESMVETAQTWHQIHLELSSPRLQALPEKRADVERRSAHTTDPTTAAHLQRALHALQAQESVVHGLQVGTERAEAAIDAQLALLERLRLAVAQHRMSDRERFNVELTAVADQVARLTDDLESLTAAIAEAEAVADRRVLADLERSGRRALAQLDEAGGRPAEVREQPAPTGEEALAPHDAEVSHRR